MLLLPISFLPNNDDDDEHVGGVEDVPGERIDDPDDKLLVAIVEFVVVDIEDAGILVSLFILFAKAITNCVNWVN